MDVSESFLSLERYQELKAVQIGMQAGNIEGPTNTAQSVERSLSGWTFPAHNDSFLPGGTGLVDGYVHRVYPRVHLTETELPPVTEACQRTLATDGLRGAWFKIRGFKKAAGRIVDAATEFSHRQAA